LFDYNSDLAWQAANPPNFTSNNGTFPTTNTILYNTALVLCAPLNGLSSLSSQCAPYIANTAAVYQACLADVMLSADLSFAQSNIDAYSVTCSANAGSCGVTIGNTSFPYSRFLLIPSAFFQLNYLQFFRQMESSVQLQDLVWLVQFLRRSQLLSLSISLPGM